MNGLYSEKGMFYRLCEWGMKLAYVNILWFFFTFIGMIVAGIAPASVSLFTVMRKWLTGQEDIPVFQTFFSTYKKEFWRANVLGCVLGTGASILFLDFLYMTHVSRILQPIILALLLTIAMFYFIICIYIFPVYTHYHLRIVQYIKHSFFIGIANPAITSMIIMSVILLCLLFVYIPAIIPFYGVSLCSFIVMKGTLECFRKIEKRLS
ncbi:MAG: YesL family protein [Anoxybacillus sp.]|nr:YesL family protein [Anoxybacillus sp.]MCL6587611.1 YesL family protein [Anoxybacillus sp.]